MARREADREDLMREATALVRRAEFRLPGRTAAVIAGFRSNGTLSLYFGPDPMYQFDEQGRLRRAFVDGLLYRTQGTTLACLRRHRMDDETQLLRQDLSPGELAEFEAAMHTRLGEFLHALTDGTAELQARFPIEDAMLAADVCDAVQRILSSAEALAPAIRGKR